MTMTSTRSDTETGARMDMTEVMSFLAVAKFRSFSKASTHLGIPQPTLTAQVKRLEADLGRTLLDRTTLPVQLTPSGERLAEMMESTYDDIDRVLTRISEGEIENSIVIAATPLVVNHILPAPIQAFLSQQPDAKVQIRVINAPDVMENVVAGEADFGVLAANPRDSRFEFRSLHEYSWVAIAPVGSHKFRSSRPAITDLADKPFVLPRKRASLIRKVLDEVFLRAGLTYKVALEVDNHDCVKRFVQSGLGISIIPKWALEPSDDEKLTVLAVRDQLPTEHVGMVTVPGKKMPSLVQQFVSVLESTIPRNEKAARSRSASSRSNGRSKRQISGRSGYR